MPSWPPFLENCIACAEEGLDCLWHDLQIHLSIVPSTWSSGKYRIGRLSGSIRIQEVQQCKSSVYMISLKSGLGRPFAIFGTTGTTVPSLSGEKTYPTSNFIPKSIFTKLQMRHISPSSAMASKHLGPHLSKDGGWHRTVRSAQRYWFVSTMAVQNGILPLHPDPAWIYSALSHMISLRSHAYDSALETWTETSLHNAAGDWENKGSACRVWVHGRTPYHSQVLFSAALKVTFCICLYGGKLMVGV